MSADQPTTPASPTPTPRAGRLTRSACRLLGVPGEATWAACTAAAAAQTEAAVTGGTPTAWDLPWIGPLRRTPIEIGAALHRLGDPVQRLRERLLWFHEAAAEDAVRDLAPDSLRNALEGWASAEEAAARHDAAFVALLAAIALDPAVEDTALWRRALDDWRTVLVDEAYWLAFVRAEVEGGFENRASLGELRELRDAALTHVGEIVADVGRAAILDDDLDAARRVVALLQGALPEPVAAALTVGLVNHLDAPPPSARRLSRRGGPLREGAPREAAAMGPTLSTLMIKRPDPPPPDEPLLVSAAPVAPRGPADPLWIEPNPDRTSRPPPEKRTPTQADRNAPVIRVVHGEEVPPGAGPLLARWRLPLLATVLVAAAVFASRPWWPGASDPDTAAPAAPTAVTPPAARDLLAPRRAALQAALRTNGAAQAALLDSLRAIDADLVYLREAAAEDRALLENYRRRAANGLSVDAAAYNRLAAIYDARAAEHTARTADRVAASAARDSVARENTRLRSASDAIGPGPR